MTFLTTRYWGFPGASDSSFNLQLSNLIYEKGKLEFGIGFERIADYSYYPALNIWSVILSKITEIELVSIARLIFPIISCSLILIYYYLIIKFIISKEHAIIASLILTLVPTFIFFESGYVKESYALIFYSILLYIMFNLFKKIRIRQLTVITFIITFAITFTHHWASYNWIITIFIIWIFPLTYSHILSAIKKNVLITNNFYRIGFIFITSILIFSWNLFVAYIIFKNQINLMSSFIIRESSEIFRPSMKLLSNEEKFIVYTSYTVLAFYGVIGFISDIFKRSKTINEIILDLWFGFCAIYIVSLTFLLPNNYNWAAISQRGWIFAFFGLSPIIAKGILLGTDTIRSGKNTKLIRCRLLILLLPLISAVLLAPLEIRKPWVNANADSYYITTIWIKQNSHNRIIATDIFIWNVMVPYGQFRYYVESSPYTLDTKRFVALAYVRDNFNLIKNYWKTFVFNKNVNELFDILADSSMFDGYYNKVYDTRSLSVYFAKK